MTEQEQREYHDKAQAAYQAHQQEQWRQHMEERRILANAAYWTQLTQTELNNAPRQKYAAIVATDLAGAFSKEGQIPWHYPADFTWFKERTMGQICVMGRTTYNQINEKLGEKGAASVLPGRKCFVVTSSPLPRDNATVVNSIGEVDSHLTEDDAINKTVFFIGGRQIYIEGIAKADTVYLTIINKVVDGDLVFPMKTLLDQFVAVKNLESPGTPDIRFTTWKRPTK